MSLVCVDVRLHAYLALCTLCHEVMVLTHEDATDEEKMPYMAIRCHPMVVKEFFGRAARRDPPCPVSDCIWWWWKDL